MFSLLIQSTKNQRVDFVVLNAPEIFERTRSLAFQKSIEGSCVCLDLSCKCLKKNKLNYAVFFFWESKLQLSFMYFSCIQKGWNLQDFRVARLLKNWCTFFDVGFSLALTIPQTLNPILKPSEGPSSKTAQFTFGLIMEELQIMKGRVCQGGFIKSRIVNWTDLSENNINDWFFIGKISIMGCVFECRGDPPSQTHWIQS